MTFRDVVLTLKKRCWLILIGAVIAGTVAVVLSLVLPPTYEAEALLLITKLRSEVTLDPRFETVAEENVVNLSVQQDQVRRQTLVKLAKSGDLLQRVVLLLGDTLPSGQRTVGHLGRAVDADTEGNLVVLRVRASDPAKAAAIANAWAAVYEEDVNRLYSATSPSRVQLQAQLDSAQSDYDDAKLAVEEFVRESPELELQRQIDQKTGILAGLQAAHLAAAQERTGQLLARLSQIDRLMLDTQDLQAQLAGAAATDPLSPGEQFGLFFVEGAAFTHGEALSVTLDIGISWQGQTPLTVGQAREQLSRLAETLEGDKESTKELLGSTSLDLLGGQELLTSNYVVGLPAQQNGADSIVQLQAQINTLQAELERQQMAKEDLENARDVAQENYLTLARKVAEIQITSELTGVEVQLAAAAQPPENRVFPGPVWAVVLGILAGGLAGLALAFVVELWPRDGVKATKS